MRISTNHISSGPKGSSFKKASRHLYRETDSWGLFMNIGGLKTSGNELSRHVSYFSIILSDHKTSTSNSFVNPETSTGSSIFISEFPDPVKNWKSVPKCVSSHVLLSEPVSVSKTVGLVASTISESSLPEFPSPSTWSFNTSSMGIKNGLSNFKNCLRISDPQEWSGSLATSGMPNTFHLGVMP